MRQPATAHRAAPDPSPPLNLRVRLARLLTKGATVSLSYLKDRAVRGDPHPADVTTVTFGGKTFRAGRRTAAHLAWTQAELTKKHPGCTVYVIQPCFNDTVAASAGTHDGDGVLDVRIDGDMGAPDTAGHWLAAQGFLRAHGWAAWWRHTGDWAAESQWHVHMVSDRCPGQVGIYVPGQIADYYAHRDGLASHAGDDTWHPPDIRAQAFDYPGWLKAATPKKARK